ncbi:MAG: TIGR01777 family oxidoreductase [Planctomycetes bacterium]|nr:TIGR01777 family oxidoreductase [Planctomycetota bacterium]
MKVLVTGATGLVGSALVPFLTAGGHEVFRLTRSNPLLANDIQWNPEAGELPTARLEGLDSVIHLAGENIAATRWNPAVKERLRQSRVNTTRLLCEALTKLDRPPKTLVSASAIGYYGDRGAEILTESAVPGSGFLADLCRDWEGACDPARQQGMRVVNLRIGVVLSPKGGGLAKMLTPFRMGVGGIIGSGRQYWSWIAIDDVVGALDFCLTNSGISGAVNGTAPNPVTNYDFTKTLGAVLGRPTFLPMPAFAARIALGEMANDLLLGSARVMPYRLSEFNYPFRYPTLDGALTHLLGKSSTS